jgi:hypothetical protein
MLVKKGVNLLLLSNRWSERLQAALGIIKSSDILQKNTNRRI